MKTPEEILVLSIDDERYNAVLERFQCLSNEELTRIIDFQHLLCLDTYNYDPRTQKYCPLAIALNLHQTIKNPTDALIGEETAKRFLPVNILKGMPGLFYTTNRRLDILLLAIHILEKRFIQTEAYNSAIEDAAKIAIQEVSVPRHRKHDLSIAILTLKKP
jgi:hypothetical protein